jgi:hypothetical protein
MALTARTPTGAVTAGTVPESWSQQVVDEAEKELVAWDATDKSWQTDLVRGDLVNIGVTNHVTSTEVVVGTKAASLDIATGSKKQLVMDQWFEAPIDVDYMTLKQTHIDWGAQARKEAAYAIRLKVDSTVTALYSTLNGNSVQGADGAKVTDQLLIDIKELLDEADVPMDADRFIIGDPSLIADMLTFDKFVAAQYVAIGAVANGQIGAGHPIYGAALRVTNNLAVATTGAYAVMIHRKAIASALQIETPWMKEFEELHERRYQHEALWGNLEIRDDHGIPFYTRKA